MPGFTEILSHWIDVILLLVLTAAFLIFFLLDFKLDSIITAEIYCAYTVDYKIKEVPCCEITFSILDMQFDEINKCSKYQLIARSR